MRILFVVVFIQLLAITAYCNPYTCLKQHHRIGQKTTLADVAEDNYDVHYLRIGLQMTDTSTYIIGGHVTTGAIVVATSMPAYVFELDSALIIDSAMVNGTRYTPIRTGFTCRINLATALTMGSSFTADVYYHGMPPSGSGFFNGVTHAISSAGTHMVYTVSDPYAAKDWWACKQSVPDKIDSVDMFVTVPAGVADGSNGLLVQTDTTTLPGWWTYHWKTNYKIDYYLISIAIARYAQYKNMHHFAGRSDSMLIHNFFMDTATFNPSYKRYFDSLGMMLDYFSEAYGLYPFTKEKYGVCFTNLGGGMEHQTMTTIGVPTTSVISHELGHQWFGDNVTYKTWGDMWLSEGFASYTEQLYCEHFWNAAAARSTRQYYHGYALGAPCGRTYVTDTTNADSLFNGATVYAKGHMIVTMLRYAAPDDSAFFRTLRTYQSSYRLGHANTADLQRIAEGFYGRPLDTFFNQWIYGRGFPVYKATWNQAGNTIYLKLTQAPSCAGAPTRFSTWLEVQLKSAAGDTFIKVYNNADTQLYVFDWPRTMTGAAINPNFYTLCRVTLPISRDTRLAVDKPTAMKQAAYPNPTRTNWIVELTEAGVPIVLLDATGKVLWQGKSEPGKNVIPGERLKPGNYMLQVEDREAIKLLHL